MVRASIAVVCALSAVIRRKSAASGAMLSLLLPVVIVLTVGAVAFRSARAQTSPIRSVMPADGAIGVWNGHRVIVDFARDMDRASAEAAMAITPTVRGHMEWPLDDRRHLEFVPHDIYRGLQAYTVTLAAGRLRDASGLPALDATYRWRFTAQQPTQRPRFSDGLPLQQLTLSAGLGLPFQPGYPRARFDARLFALNGAQFAARYAALTRVPELDLQALDPAGLEPQQSWTVDVDASITPARLSLPDGLKAGLYLVEILHPALPPARELLVYSDYGLEAKAGRRGLLVWAARQPEGSLAPDANISVYDADGRRTTVLDADAQGLARLPERGSANLLVAMVKGQPAVVALDRWWPSRGNAGGERQAGQPLPDVVAHLHSDRPIYRPGHTVHWKAVLQQVRDEGLRPLGASETVTVTLRDAAGNMVQQLARQPDEFGGIAGDLALADGAALGVWRLQALARGQLLSGSFQVQDYVKPDFKVELTTDRPYYIDGQKAQITVQADYYFGQPVSGGELVLRVFDNGWTTRTRPLAEIKGVLDAEGSFSTDVALALRPPSDGRPVDGRYTIEAELTDASRRPVYGTLDRPVHPADFGLSAAVNGYSQPYGRPVAVTLNLRDHEGRPVAGRAVELSAYRSYPHGGSTVGRVAAVTGADGQALARLGGLDVGWYQLTATARDDLGRLARADTYVWVYSLTRPWYWSGALAIEADRPSYQPGDTARLLIKSPITTTALITLEGTEVLAERVVSVAGATTVELPITADMAPGVTARVTLWEPVTHDSRNSYDQAADGRLLGAKLELPVPAKDRRLQVAVVPDRGQARPGDPLTLRLSVRDAAGRPVRAQLSLALVDQALLALARDASGDMFDGLWGFRRSLVSGHDSWSPSSWWWSRSYDPSQRYLPRPTGAPGSSTATPAAAPAPSPTLTSGGGADGPAEEPAPQPRRDLPDTAYWNAAIVTDAQGEAAITLTLPDSLTTWQALARAVDLSGRAGQGSAEVLVSKPVSVEAALPRFLVQGDRLAVDLLARNDASLDPLEGFCRLDSPGLIQLDQGERRLSMEHGAMTVARWSAVAADVGLHSLTATLRTPMGDDAVEQPLRVEAFTVPEPFARSGVVIQAPVTETLDLPLGAHPDRSLVEVTLSPSLASSILGGLTGLINYPYGCVEQTMSRMLPNGVVGRLIQEMDLDAPDLRSRLPAMMAAGLQKLFGYQSADGSWGWWNGGGNTYITAYVLHGLTLVKASGYDVDQQVLDRGFAALGRLLPKEPDAGVQAYDLFVMAEAGRVDEAAVLNLNAQRARLDAFALGALVLALRAAGRQDLADEALDLLLSQAIRDESGVHWAPSPGSGSSGARSMASAVKTTSMALLVLSRLRPEDPLAPDVVRWLMGQRNGADWGRSTHDSAWALLALTDWIVASGELTASYAWRLTWDGREVAAGRHDSGRNSVAPPIVVRLAGADLTPGKHELALFKDPGGRMYYSLAGRIHVFHPDFKAVAAAGSGLSLYREYLAIDGRQGPERWQPGDLINVRLTLQTTQELSYLMLQDWLPAGFEAVNTALDTETKRLPNGQLPWWRWWGYERRELRDEGATFFMSRLPAGRSTFEYAVRAVTPGRFGARPAEAYAMYRPELWARSDSRRVDIALNKLADLPPLAGDLDGDCRLTGFDADLVAAGSWTADAARDLDGSGLVDVLDIALADARSGLSCGSAVPAAPAAAGEARLDVDAERAADGTLTLTVRTGQAVSLDSWELTVDLPTSGSKLIETVAVRPTAASRALGPVLDARGRRLRLGGYLPGGAALPAETVLARVRLQSPGRATSTSLVAVGALAAAPDGRPLSVTVGGDAVRPAPLPWGAWLPSVGRP